jgi:hypothetical protein
MIYPINGPLDTNIAPVVYLLREQGFNTFTSCDGGEGHAFRYPTVRIAPDGSILSAESLAARTALFLLEAGYKGFFVKAVYSYGGSVEIGGKIMDSFVEVEFWTETPTKEEADHG